MKEIKRMMVCVDLSDYSKETLEYAAALGKNLAPEVLIFNVLNIRDVDAVRTASKYYPESIDVDAYVGRAREDRHRRLQEMVRDHFNCTTARLDVIIRIGIPFEEILKIIDEHGIDIVVMGNKGRSDLARTLFGSNAEKVFRHSPVPVVCVRSRERLVE